MVGENGKSGKYSAHTESTHSETMLRKSQRHSDQNSPGVDLKNCERKYRFSKKIAKNLKQTVPWSQIKGWTIEEKHFGAKSYAEDH